MAVERKTLNFPALCRANIKLLPINAFPGSWVPLLQIFQQSGAPQAAGFPQGGSTGVFS